MAASSIFTNIKITDAKKAEIFIEALEASANDTRKNPPVSDIPVLSDLDEIRKLVANRASICKTNKIGD